MLVEELLADWTRTTSLQPLLSKQLEVVKLRPSTLLWQDLGGNVAMKGGEGSGTDIELNTTTATVTAIPTPTHTSQRLRTSTRPSLAINSWVAVLEFPSLLISRFPLQENLTRPGNLDNSLTTSH